MKINVRGQALELLPEKALYKPDESLLVIADVHLGKAKHFRKEGIPFPCKSQDEDYDKLSLLLERIRPRKVYFLGDLFHSQLNSDWACFEALVKKYTEPAYTLISGNHDIIDFRHYDRIGVEVVKELEDAHFRYTHKPEEGRGKINVAGHIHPGIAIADTMHRIKLPCFYFADERLLLPAFGALTGLYMIRPAAGSDVYAVLPSRIAHLDLD